MLAIESAQSGLSKNIGKMIHLGALAAALGDGRDWEYRGEVIDHGPPSGIVFNPAQCACGHQIRYGYIVHHKTDNRTAQLGSSCINHFETVAPGTFEALKAAVERTERKIADAKKKAREVQQDAEILELTARLERAQMAAWDAAGRYPRFRVPQRLWSALESRCGRYPTKCPEYQRKADAIRWLKGWCQNWEKLTEVEA